MVSDAPGEKQGDPADRDLSRRLGRDLVAAIVVGILFGAIVVAALFVVKVVFVGFVVVLVVIAVTELEGALRPSGVRLPLIPLLAGVVGMLVGAYVIGAPAVLAAVGLTVLVVSGWRLVGGRDGYVRDVTAAVFVALYVPFLASFCVLMLRPDDGPSRVVLFVAVTVASDIGGYAAGVAIGRHKLAPSISPGKTWEGLAGSALACVIVGVAGVVVLLDGNWLAGLILGLVAVVSATFGDLMESMIKRDVDIKDMGSLLPGHGGVMDRLDSLLPSALASWFVLELLVPVGG